MNHDHFLGPLMGPTCTWSSFSAKTPANVEQWVSIHAEEGGEQLLIRETVEVETLLSRGDLE